MRILAKDVILRRAKPSEGPYDGIHRHCSGKAHPALSTARVSRLLHSACEHREDSLLWTSLEQCLGTLPMSRSLTLCLCGEDLLLQLHFPAHQFHDFSVCLSWRPARIDKHNSCGFSLRNRHKPFAHATKERARLLLKTILVVTMAG